VGKRALMAYQRYAPAKQFKRANRALRSVRTWLGRVLRDVMRKSRDDANLSPIFAEPLSLAFRVRHQNRSQRGRKVYSLHAPEVEMRRQGQGASSVRVRRQGVGRHHARPLEGRPVHRPRQDAAGKPASLARIVADRGYRGHNAPPGRKMKAYISGQKRGATGAIKRDLRRRSAVEPVIGHAKNEHRMGRNFLKGTATPPTPCSPPPAKTSAGCWPGSPPFGVFSSWPCSPMPRTPPSRPSADPDLSHPRLRRKRGLLHGRLKTSYPSYDRTAPLVQLVPELKKVSEISQPHRRHWPSIAKFLRSAAGQGELMPQLDPAANESPHGPESNTCAGSGDPISLLGFVRLISLFIAAGTREN
jgi:hypothetical protein